MLALMYADWIVLRRTFLRYLLVTLFVMTPVVGMGSGEGEIAAGTAVATLSVTMMSVYMAISLFGYDETNDWEQYRLTLPTSARQVVRSRYALTALTVAGTAAVGTALGVLIQRVIPLIHGTVAAPRGTAIIALASLGTALVVMAFLAIEMPFVFKLGISKARMAFTIPFLLCLLINVEPVRNVVMPVLDGLEAYAHTLGSPAPLFAGGAVLVALLFVGSMRVSEHLYAGRDF